jgi:hypothetical protein
MKGSATEHIKKTKLDGVSFLVALPVVMCSHQAGKLPRNPINKVNSFPLPRLLLYTIQPEQKVNYGSFTQECIHDYTVKRY